MDDHLQCPICFETPPGDIYQCTNGHTICSDCSKSIQLCPQCRVPYGTTKIRNRALEQILDKQTFNCVFKDGGCLDMFKRQDIAKHGLDCYYNPASTAVRLCQMLGFDDCKFIIRSSSRSQIIKHFQDSHDVPVEPGRSVNIQHADFKEVTDPCATTNCFWSPVLLNCDLNGSLILIHGKIDIHQGSVGWAGIGVWKSKDNCSENCQIEFTLISDEKANNKNPVMWTIPLVSLEEAEESVWDSYPAMISMAFLRKYFENEAEVLANVSIKTKPFQDSNGGNYVWVFSTPLEKEKIQEEENLERGKAGLQPPTIFQNITCDGCNKSPIVGKRYQCLQCEKFDLCENCMEQQIHSHHVFAFRNKIEPGKDRLVKKIASYAGKLSILT